MVNESMLLCYCCSDKFDSECRVSAKALVISEPLIQLHREPQDTLGSDVLYSTHSSSLGRLIDLFR